MSTSVSSSLSGSLSALGSVLQDAARLSAKAGQDASFSAEFQALINGALQKATQALELAQQPQATAPTAAYQPTVSLSTNPAATASPVPAASSRSQLERDFQTYFSQVQPGQVVQIAEGAVTRNADGSATWRSGDKSYTFNASSSIDEVARNSGLGKEWTKSYGIEWPAQTANAPVKAPFTDFESFKSWEKGLGNQLAADYEVPDYIGVIRLSLHGGDAEAFQRYVFFKNHPDMAADYQNIRNGGLSSFPVDGSTLIKSKLSEMPADVADYYRANPDSLRMAEGFDQDPTLARLHRLGKAQPPEDLDASSWLRHNKWTAAGVVPNDNRISFANADYIGLNGSMGGTYKLAQWDTATGGLRDLDGKVYATLTGTLMA